MIKAFWLFVILVSIGVVQVEAQNNRLDYCGPRGGWSYGGEDICIEAMKQYNNIPIDWTCCQDSKSYQGKCFPNAWTEGWDRMQTYCEPPGYWRNVIKTQYGQTVNSFDREGFGSIRMQVYEAPPPQQQVPMDDDCDEDDPPPTTTPPPDDLPPPVDFTTTFNSPFLYLDGLTDGQYDISMDSGFDTYRAAPALNQCHGWRVNKQDEKIFVDQEVLDHLFYELDLPDVWLSRNGVNFHGIEALSKYLENSDFFKNLGMNPTQKLNSLEYAMDSLSSRPPSRYYYLAVLSDLAIQQISTLTVIGPDGTVPSIRRYYAIYPTRVPIRTDADGIVFPSIESIDGHLVEYGEVIVKPSMQVFWE